MTTPTQCPPIRRLPSSTQKRQAYASRAEDFQVARVLGNAQGWNDLGELLAKTGSADEAINAFQQAIELEPQNRSGLCKPSPRGGIPEQI